MNKSTLQDGASLLEVATATPYAFERVQRDSGGTEVARLEAQNLLMEKAGPMAQLPPTPLDGAILDVGSGTGFWSLRLAGRVPRGRITCLDRSAELLALARQRLAAAPMVSADFLRQDLRALALPERAFDLAFTCVTLAHVQELEQALGPILASLKPGGWLACFEPIHHSGRFCEVHPPCPNLHALVDQVTEEVRSRGSDLAVSLKLAHLLDRKGMEDVVLRDYGRALHGEDAMVCLREVFLPLAKAYLPKRLPAERLAGHLEGAAQEAAQPHLWVDVRRAVVLTRNPG